MAGRAASAEAVDLPVVRAVAELRAAVAGWRRRGESIGLVPTMGALHAGRRALVQRARADCVRVVATLFVNPMQFDRADDLAGYPRDEAADRAMLLAAGADLLYAPEVAVMYPPGFATSVTVGGLGDCLCGAARPGHMTGVSTVVAKLLLQALPDAAYFGEKDYQQLLIVRRMARDLDMPLEVRAVETLREADGLALSSRNKKLSAAERAAAPALYRELSGLGQKLADGRDAEPELARARAALAAAGFRHLDYLELRAEESLAPLARAEGPARVFAAAWLGDTRLIDNVRIEGR